MRFRYIYIGLGSILVIMLSLLSDPDTGFIQNMTTGAGTLATIIVLSKGILYAALLHFTRKGLADYFDMETALNKAMETSEGAGKAMIAMALYANAMAIVIYAATR